MLTCGNAVAQEFTEILTLYFRNADGEYDRDYKSNGANSDEFFKNIERIQSIPEIKIKEIVTKGTTSPEGNVDFNRTLAEKRRLSFKDELNKNLDFPDYKIEVNPNPDCWNEVSAIIESDPEISDKDTVLSIIRKGGDDMINSLKAYKNGEVYKYISDYIFPQLRTYQVAVTFDMSAHILPVNIPDSDEIERSLEFFEDGLDFVEFIYPEDVPFLKVERYKRKNYTVVADPIPREYAIKLKMLRAQKERRELREERKLAKGKVVRTHKTADHPNLHQSAADKYQNTPINAQTHPEKYAAEVKPTIISEVKPEKKPQPEKVKKEKKPINYEEDRLISIKTNTLGLGLGVANMGFEFDVSDNMSLNLPFYYSGWELYSETFKFKGLIFRPELRFYIPKTGGLYLGVHTEAAWYNMALGGNYRYQNCGWSKPTVGAGLDLGYRIPLGKKTGWGIELGLGGGVHYSVHDRFYNEPNGPYAAQNVNKFYYGIDNVSVSLVYSFNIKRGDRR